LIGQKNRLQFFAKLSHLNKISFLYSHMKTPPTDLDEGTIRRIDWQELCPAVLLPQAVSIATTFRVLWIASFGVLLTLFLAMLLNEIHSLYQTGEVLINGGPVSQDFISIDKTIKAIPIPNPVINWLCPFDRYSALIGVNQSEKRPDCDRVKYKASVVDPGERIATLPTPDTILLPWRMMSNSLERLFSQQNVFSLAWFLGVLGIWGLCGAIITRTAATQITIGQYSRWSHLKNFLKWRLLSYFAAILIPVTGLLLCAFAVKIACLLLVVPVANQLVAILFPIVLFLGFCFAILGIGLLFGWPLAFAAVSVDGSDGFDAVSRAYSYVYQRPLQYLVYAVLGIILGMIGYFFIAWFVDLTLALIAGWGNAPFVDFVALAQGGTLESGRQFLLTDQILLFWCWCFQMVKIGFLFGYFWVCSTVIYVILRRSVDGTPIDEIRFPPNDQPGVLNMPSLKTDEKGAPEVAQSTG